MATGHAGTPEDVAASRGAWVRHPLQADDEEDRWHEIGEDQDDPGF